MRKQQETCTTCFFLGIILVGRQKFKNKTGKNNTKPKKVESITFCCGDCRKKHGCELAETRGGKRGWGFPAGLLPEEPQEKRRRLAGAQTSASVKREWG